jgi:hypothetical protein
MPSDDSGSISHWLGALRGDDLEAAQPLLHRYSASLVQFAQAGALRQAMTQGGRFAAECHASLRRCTTGSGDG